MNRSSPIQRILVAEDDATIAFVVRRYLEMRGCEVVAALDGEAAWEAIQAGNFDALVSDLGLPGIDGLELGRRVRADRRFEGVRTIAVTAYDVRRIGPQVVEAGFDALFQKPLDLRDLWHGIQGLEVATDRLQHAKHRRASAS